MDQYEADLNKRLKSHGRRGITEVKIIVLENPKNKKLSIKLKFEGNEYFAERDFIKAVICYNKALCCAVKGSEDVGGMYANRFAVALEIKSYAKCLKNIELAREHNFPKQRLLKLEEREERCKKMISSKKTLEKGNKKLIEMLYGPFTEPYLNNCLEIVNNKNEKPYLITNKNLKVGDLIAIQKPFLGILTDDNFYRNCSNCMKDCVFDLIPCDKCASAMFCSVNCKNSAFEFHQYECGIFDSLKSKFGCENVTSHNSKALFKALSLFNGSVEEMKQFLEEPNESSRESFTLDICNNEKQYLKAVYSHKYHSDVYEELILEKNLSYYPKIKEMMVVPKLRTFVIRFILKISGTILLRFPVKETIGGLYPLETVTSLSCAPNVCSVILNDCKVVFIVQHPIKSGEKITTTNCCDYRTENKMERQEKILQIYKVKCECVACVKNYSMFLQQKFISKRSLDFANHALVLALTDNDIDAFKEYHENCQYIQNNFAKFPCQEISMKIATNRFLLNEKKTRIK